MSCYFLIYFRAVEFDTSRRLNIGNVYVRGSGDTYLAEARVNARTFFASRSVDSCEVCWNGKFNASAKKPCVAFNLDEPLPQG